MTHQPDGTNPDSEPAKNSEPAGSDASMESSHDAIGSAPWSVPTERFETSPDQPVTTVDRGRNPGRRAVLGTVVGTAIIALAQAVGPMTDHQLANLGSGVVFLVALLYVLYQLHCLVKQSGYRYVVPGLAVAVVATLAVMFRLEGFSGEMMPQFAYRFSNDRMAFRSLGESTSDDSVAGDQALADSTGFLGSDRTAVILDRQFDIPKAIDEAEVVWDQGIGDGWSSFAVSGDRAVTLEQRDDIECVTCYRLSDGELLWMVSHEARHEHALGGVGPRSTPTIDAGRVYAQGATGMLWCLDLANGDEIWSVDLLDLAGWDKLASEAAITWGRSGSPLVIDGELCVVPFGGPELNAKTGRSLLAVDAQTGKTRWAAGEDQISYASPGLLTLGGQRQIVSVNEKTITGHRVDDGTVLWETEWFGESNGGANCAMAVQAGPNRFLIGKGYGGGSALFEVTKPAGVWKVEPIWESNRILKTKFTHAAVVDDVAYAISNGSLEAVGIEEGERSWSQGRRSRFGQGQILVVEDVIVGQTEPGEVVFVAADPSEYRELLRLPALTAKTWNVPTIAGRHLLVRNDRQAICFRLPERRDANVAADKSAATQD